MTVFEFVVAVIAGLPALLTAIAAFIHSMSTRAGHARINARLDRLEGRVFHHATSSHPRQD